MVSMMKIIYICTLFLSVGCQNIKEFQYQQNKKIYSADKTKKTNAKQNFDEAVKVLSNIAGSFLQDRLER